MGYNRATSDGGVGGRMLLSKVLIGRAWQVITQNEVILFLPSFVVAL